MSAAHQAELHPNEKYKAKKLAGRVFKATVPLGVLMLGISLAFGATQEDDHMHRFFFSYITALTYFLSFALGALWFVILQPLTRSKWSPVVRRLAEILTSTFPILGVLMLGILIPMLAGSDGPYHWANDTLRETDHVIHGKAAWLNEPFFVIRILVYFAVWTVMSQYFLKKSVEQDETGDVAISERLRVVSAPCMLIFALTTCFAAFDLLMSLNPHWFSTIFGVYYFAGCVIAVYATLAITSRLLQKKGKLVHSITVEHYHDLGKMLFAFVFFWSYIAFSQFMLIWYANIPEETIFYQPRMYTDWQYVSIFLLVFHCIIPFLFLLSRWTKRILWRLMLFSVWMLVVHYVDLWWVVMPEYIAPGALQTEMPTKFSQYAMDITALIGVGCLFVAAAARTASKVNLLPIRDPKLGESLSFENY